MVSILGHHISMIRPSKYRHSKILKNERPRAKYNTRPRKISEHCGRVIALAIKTKSGLVIAARAATHLHLCEEVKVGLEDITATGWLLDHGGLVWESDI